QAVFVSQANPPDLYALHHGRLQQLTVATPQSELFPAVDANFQFVAFIEVEEDGQTRLKVMNLANLMSATLLESTNVLKVMQYPLAWSPDGKTLLVTLENTL